MTFFQLQHDVAAPSAHPTLPFGEWWSHLWRWLTSCRLPQTRGEKTLAIVAGAILLAAAMAIYGVQLLGVCPVMGHSMEPTLPFLGGYYVLDAPNAPLCPGDLVALKSGSTLGRSIKRVKAISSQGVVVVGDNINNSMDSEYGLRTDGQVVAIPLSDVRRVRDIWTPMRFLRCFSERGRLINQVELKIPPKSRQISREAVVFVAWGQIHIVGLSACHVGKLSVVVPEWCCHDDVVEYNTTPVDKVQVNLATGGVSKVSVALTPNRYPDLCLDLLQIAVPGDRSNWLGRKVEYPDAGDSVPAYSGVVRGVKVEGQGDDSVSWLKTDPPVQRAGYPDYVVVSG